MRRMTSQGTHLVAALAVTAAGVLAACTLPLPAHAFTDSGPMPEKQVAVARPVRAFSVLLLDGPVDVHAHQGTTPGITVHAYKSIEPLVETVIEGDKLVVRLKDGTIFKRHDNVFVDVVFTSLTAVQQHGSGDLRIDRLTAPRFESSIAGSGDVILSGSADEARFGVAGSGDINARNFAAKKVSVSISGSGDAHVNATEVLEAKVAGSGDVTYSGHPRDVSRRVSGSGSVEAAN